MDEKELASELQAAKFDSDEWGDDTPELTEDAPSVGSGKSEGPKRRLAAMVSVRLSPEELEAVQARASKRGESVSGYLRGLAVRDINMGAEGFHLPISVSTGETYVTQFGTQVLTDGGRLFTRAS